MERQVIYRATVVDGSLIANRGFEENLPLDSACYSVLGKVSGRYFNDRQVAIQRNEEEIVAIIRGEFPEVNLVAFKLSRFPPRSSSFPPEVGLAVKISSAKVLELLKTGSGTRFE